MTLLLRLVCTTVGHAWNRHLGDGHPSKSCDRCGSTEWAARVRTSV